jgi:hypothetical protein
VNNVCSSCGARIEETVVSGIVSLKRRRTMVPSARVSAIRAETCVRCGRTEMFAARPERLFSDLRED